MTEIMAGDRSPRWGRMAALAAAGLVCGAPAGLVIGRLIKHSQRSHLMTWSDILSLSIGAMLLILGLVICVASLTQRGSAFLVDPKGLDPDRPATPAQAAFYRLQGLVFVLAGALLMAPVLVSLAAPGVAPAVKALAFAAVAVGFALQTWLNALVWRGSDELIRRASSEGAVVTFWVLQAILFLYAAAEKLKLVPALTSWEAVTILMGLYLVMSVVVAWRRGLS